MAKPGDIKKKYKAIAEESKYIPSETNTHFAEASAELASAGYNSIKEDGVLMVLLEKPDTKNHKEIVKNLEKSLNEVLKIVRGAGYMNSVAVRYADGG